MNTKIIRTYSVAFLADSIGTILGRSLYVRFYTVDQDHDSDATLNERADRHKIYLNLYDFLNEEIEYVANGIPSIVSIKYKSL